MGPGELELLADALDRGLREPEPAEVKRMSVARLLAGKRICVCGGSGGVGKTTTSAAIALGMAAEGAKVAVVTIDPAKRLANALGLDELENEPSRVAPRAAGRHRGQGRALGDDARPQANL